MGSDVKGSSPAGLPFLTGSVISFCGQNFCVWPGNWRESTLGITGFHVRFWFCWHQARTFGMHWGGLQPNVKQLQWELAPPSFQKKGWLALFGLVEKAWLKWRSFSILRSCTGLLWWKKTGWNYQPANQHSHSHLWSWILDNDQKDKIPDSSGQNDVAELHMEARASFTDASLRKCPRHVPPG